MNKKLIGIAMAGTAALVLSACSTSTSSPAPTQTSTTMESPTSQESMAAGTIVDVAAENPDFSTLVTAVQAAGLTETLSAA